MVRPYSMDLRERVVAAVMNEGMSACRAAARLGISESSAIKWVRRHRQTVRSESSGDDSVRIGSPPRTLLSLCSPTIKRLPYADLIR